MTRDWLTDIAQNVGLAIALLLDLVRQAGTEHGYEIGGGVSGREEREKHPGLIPHQRQLWHSCGVKGDSGAAHVGLGHSLDVGRLSMKKVLGHGHEVELVELEECALI